MFSSDRLRSIVSLVAVAAVALCTLWLALTGRLGLYINPRYLVFTVVLAALAVAASAAALVGVIRGGGDHGHDDHHGHEEDKGHDGDHEPEDDHGYDGDHGHEESHGHDGDHEHDVDQDARPRHRPRPTARVAAIVATAVVVVTTGAMLVLPPATLSARTAEQRAVNAGSLSNATGASGASSLGDTSKFGVKDWAAVIRSSTNSSQLVGRPLTLTGFVVRGSGSFTLTRFVISCCAVDAQPVGVEVLDGAAANGATGATGEATGGSSGGSSDPSASDLKNDQWVTITGSLVANPDVSSDNRLVIQPTAIRRITQPTDPYEY